MSVAFGNTVALTVPRDYGYVVIAAGASCFLGLWQAMRVGSFRRAAGVPYPIPYASANSASPKAKEEYLFNCAQRAHGNYLENHPTFLVTMLISGLKYPIISSVMGAAWLLFRVVYAVGYTRADKEGGKGRLAGSGFWLAQIGLTGMSMKVGYDMLMG